jgi:hypothetical protein
MQAVVLVQMKKLVVVVAPIFLRKGATMVAIEATAE